MSPDLFQTVFVCSLVFVAGFVDSIAGGGGLRSTPAYVAAGLPPHIALGTNKFSGFFGTLSAVISYLRAGKAHLKAGVWATIGSITGSAIGAKLVCLASAQAINTMMLTVIPAVLIFFLFKNRFMPERKSGEPVKNLAQKALAIGFVVGAYDGFFGPGTGTLLTVAFFSFLGLDLMSSAGSARLSNMGSNVGSLAVFLINGKVLFPLALYAAAAGIAGNQLGAALALKKGEKIIKPFMALVLLLLLAEVARRRFAT